MQFRIVIAGISRLQFKRPKRRSKSQNVSVFDFIRHVLLSCRDEQQNETYRQACITFAMKFQQFTSPVMAKGLEDTSFYRYHALMSINDVGGKPD